MVGGVVGRGVVGVGAGATVGVGAGAGVDTGAGFDAVGALQVAWATAATGAVAPDAGAAASTPVVGTVDSLTAPVLAGSTGAVDAGASPPPDTGFVAVAGAGCSMASAAMIVQVAARLRPTVKAREAGAADERDERRGPFSDTPVRSAADRGVSEAMGQSSISDTVTTSTWWGDSMMIASSSTASSREPSISSDSSSSEWCVLGCVGGVVGWSSEVSSIGVCATGDGLGVQVLIGADGAAPERGAGWATDCEPEVLAVGAGVSAAGAGATAVRVASMEAGVATASSATRVASSWPTSEEELAVRMPRFAATAALAVMATRAVEPATVRARRLFMSRIVGTPDQGGKPRKVKVLTNPPDRAPERATLGDMHLLLVEDDDAIAAPLAKGLERQNFSVHRESTGLGAVEAAAGRPSPNIVLLDLGLPDIDGFEVCRRIRAVSSVPIIVITARGEEIDRVLGLELGADDYMVKPFGFRELVARIHAVTRRVGARDEPEEPIVHLSGGFTIDNRTRRLTRDDEEIVLTRKEFDLLALLATDPGATFTREDILEQVWDAHWYGPTKTLDVHVASLRKKVGDPELVETVRGVGFRLRADDESPRTAT